MKPPRNNHVISGSIEDTAMTVEGAPGIGSDGSVADIDMGGDKVCNNDHASVERIRQFYCTTSSVYAENTISNPNHQQISYW